MRTGRLRHRMIIYSVTKSNGVSGAETLTAICTVWCAIEPMSGKEFQGLGGTTNTLTSRITMRYINNIDTSKIGIYNGRRFKFTQVINPDEKNKELQIVATEVFV